MIFSNGMKDIYLVSIDTLFISGELKSVITEQITEHFGQKDESDIIILSTHTPYAPSLERESIKLGLKDNDYYKYLLAQLVNLFKDSTAEPFKEVKFSISEGKSNGITCNSLTHSESRGYDIGSFDKR